MDSLEGMTHHVSLCSVDHLSLSRKIIALHLAHSSCKSDLQQFGQLVQLRPAVINSLHKTDKALRTGMVSNVYL